MSKERHTHAGHGKNEDEAPHVKADVKPHEAHAQAEPARPPETPREQPIQDHQFAILEATRRLTPHQLAQCKAANIDPQAVAALDWSQLLVVIEALIAVLHGKAPVKR